MLKLKRKFIILILVMLFEVIKTGQTASLKQSSFENQSFEEKKITKRGHYGSENGYGPPIHITSGVLHFDDATHVKEPTIIHQGVLSHDTPTWNDIATEWQLIHSAHQPNSDEQPNLGGGGIVWNIPPTIYNGGGLHTHIIGSSSGSGQSITNLDDKIDLNNNIDTKEKYFIKSYG